MNLLEVEKSKQFLLYIYSFLACLSPGHGVAGAEAYPSVQWVRDRLHPGVTVSPSELTEIKKNKKNTFTPTSSQSKTCMC